MAEVKKVPVLYNPVIYNPAYIDYYLLTTLQEFQKKFHTVHLPYEKGNHAVKLLPEELTWVRLTAENALAEAFLTQRDQTRLLLRDRLVTILLLALWEAVVWHSRGFLTAIYTLLPTAGILDVSNNIIMSHRDYKNALYAASVVCIENALAVVKGPERYSPQRRKHYEQTLGEKIQEAAKQVAIKRKEIKNAWQDIGTKSSLNYVVDRLMYGACRLLAAFRIFGINIPSQTERKRWQSAINKIAPMGGDSSRPEALPCEDEMEKVSSSASLSSDSEDALHQEFNTIKQRLSVLEKDVEKLIKSHQR